MGIPAMIVRTKQLKLHAGRAAFLLILLGLWEVLAGQNAKADFSISRPSVVAKELMILFRDLSIFKDIGITGWEALAGLLLGTLIGSSCGLITWFSKFTSNLLKPFVVALGAMPVLAVAPLMIIWFGIGINMKIALACLSTVFVAYAQSAIGVDKVSQEYLDTLRGMNASRWQIFKIAIIPGTLDWIFGAMKTNTGLALLGAFIGEFISSNQGLGYLILRAAGLYNVPRALAVALLIIALALLFDWLATLVERKRNFLIERLCIPNEVWKSALV
ncbi:MAG: ABC transporter permease [Planctomycetota bacterium]|jgi:NitT/TauT family transport system permease protein|nr:ABC transporter permease [Planctomycetota bacterium]